MGNTFHNSSPKSPATEVLLSLRFHKNSIKVKINIYGLIPTRNLQETFPS